jgi:tetratricopeptide (TPR) repeat protein
MGLFFYGFYTMKKNLTSTILLLFLILQTPVYAQLTNKEKAVAQLEEAVRLMDQGLFKDAIRLLEQSRKLDYNNYSFPYEMGYAYYVLKNYNKTRELLEPLILRKDINDMVFQLLGNTYDMLGKKEKAIQTYRSGIKRFPQSGRLYVELGILEFNRKNISDALYYFEKGIKAEPDYPSSYFHSAEIYLRSDLKVWGLIYGEIFMNLERTTDRNQEMSRYIGATYYNQIEFSGDSLVFGGLCREVSMQNGKDSVNTTIEFDRQVYQPLLLYSLKDIKEINLYTLHTLRSQFLENYFEMDLDEVYPIVLFSYQKKVKEAGHLEAYNYWTLREGNPMEFEEWRQSNLEKLNSFIEWYAANPMIVNQRNLFFRSQF